MLSVFCWLVHQQSTLKISKNTKNIQNFAGIHKRTFSSIVYKKSHISTKYRLSLEIISTRYQPRISTKYQLPCECNLHVYFLFTAVNFSLQLSFSKSWACLVNVWAIESKGNTERTFKPRRALTTKGHVDKHNNITK